MAKAAPAFTPSPANVSAAVAMLEAQEPTAAASPEAPAAEVSTEAPAAEAAAATEADQAAAAVEGGLVAPPAEEPPPAAEPPKVDERAARQARLDEQLRVLREGKAQKRAEKAQKIAAKKQEAAQTQQAASKDQELSGKIAEFESDPVDYLLKNGKDAAALMQKLANAAREAGTPEAKIAAMEKSFGAKVESLGAKLEALEKENLALKEESAQREKQREQSAKTEAYQRQLAAEEAQFMEIFTPQAFPFARAYLKDPAVLKKQVFETAREMRLERWTERDKAAGRSPPPVPFVDIANRLEGYAKAHAKEALATLAPLLQGSNGTAKSDPKAASAPKGKGATTLSNDLASQAASNRSRRLSEKERMAAAVRVLEAAESK